MSMMHETQSSYMKRLRHYENESAPKLTSKLKRHVCPVPECGRRFATSGNLSRHKHLHGKIEPLKCPTLGCKCAFPSQRLLERHLQYHRGEGVKLCPVADCGKTFTTTGNVNRHLKKHHALSPFATFPRCPTSSPSSMQSGYHSPTGVDRDMYTDQSASDSSDCELSNLPFPDTSIYAAPLEDDMFTPDVMEYLECLLDTTTPFLDQTLFDE